MMSLLEIYWNADPVLIHIGSFSLRWYSLLFAAGLVMGWYMMEWFLRREKLPDKLTGPIYLIITLSLITGLRLGHCIFYNPQYYFGSWEGFTEIFRIWKGGLASHGGAVGVLLGAWLFTAIYGKKNGFDYLWVLDHLVIIAAFIGAMVRIGNFFNSEIYGPQTTLPWGVIFARRGEVTPHHPTQLYEAVCYLILGAVLLWLYKHKLEKLNRGFLLGLFLTLCFGSRFIIEYVKNARIFVDLGPLHMTIGQALSVPFIIAGICLLILSSKTRRLAPKL